MHTTLITTADLEPLLGKPDVVVCDVRHDLMHPETLGPAEYAKGHVPGAQFVHLDRDLSARKTGTNGRHPLPYPDAAAAVFSRLGIGDGSQVIVYDQGQGMYASRLWWMLRWLGHDAVAVLDGGYAKWTREGREVTTEVQEPQPALFRIRRVIPTVSASGVRASLHRHTLFLIDARAPERFRGDVEPIDPVAGHIPGAHNRPWTQNLNADGTFKHPAFLRAEFNALLEGASHETVVHQCGSGVSACHNLLAMEVAGFPGTRLYPGSWSEWSADPSRPVAREP
ncbi:MAG TPA: sulfurtransferase [Casimicrobiaceae bacterium]|nr:sulfurtransferase [Casimicrobiaceae bacterium]